MTKEDTAVQHHPHYQRQDTASARLTNSNNSAALVVTRSASTANAAIHRAETGQPGARTDVVRQTPVATHTKPRAQASSDTADQLQFRQVGKLR